MTIVCGDSHTSTHGAFGALAFGIGTSPRSSTSWPPRPSPRTSPRPSASTSTAYFPSASPPRTSSSTSSAASAPPAPPATSVEYAGSAIRALSMEGRMTVCNMSIEAGARAGMIAPTRPPSPTSKAAGSRPAPVPPAPLTGHEAASSSTERGVPVRSATSQWAGQTRRTGSTIDEALVESSAVAHWSAIRNRPRRRPSTANSTSTPAPCTPTVTWGTSSRHDHHHRRDPSPLLERMPTPPRPTAKSFESRLEYMGLAPGTPMETGQSGSTPSSSAPAPTPASKICAPPPRSSRGHHVATTVRAMVVPGSQAGEAPGRTGRPRPQSSPSPPASTGASPAAPCVSA